MDATILLGAGAALGSALAWAVGSILYRKIGEQASPLGMNLGKGLLGLVLLGVGLLAAGYQPMDQRSTFYLVISGLVGIALGDTFFFMALVRIDPRQTLLLGTVGQVFTVLLALVLLGERPSALTWIGIVAVLGGVTWVLRERLPRESPARRRERTLGVLYGLLAAGCMALGIICAKVGVEGVPTIQATWVRLLGGVLGLLLWGLARRSLRLWLAPFRSPSLLRSILVAVVVTIFGGFWLSIVALKYIDASVATILTSTEPLFILPLVVIFLREKVSMRATIGACVAVCGVLLILVGLNIT